MNLIQAGYTILVTLSIVDGEFDEAEGKVIVDFLDDNFDGSFDPIQANKDLMSLDDAGILARFKQAVKVFGAGTGVEDKEALLEFGIDLVMTDGELTEEENNMVREISEAWDVPLQPLVARAMGIA